MDTLNQHGMQSVKRPREEITDTDVHTQTRKRPRTVVTIPGRRHMKYQRYSKPPYTYLGMMVLAIQSSPDKSLTLADIQAALVEMFPFFQGEYRGWRDSVRHNLSHNACFVKTSRKQTNKSSSGCFWTVDLTLVPADAFKRGRVPKDMEEKWAPTLTQQLQVPDMQLPTPRTPPKKTWPCTKRQTRTATSTAATTSQDGAPQFLTPSRSLSYTEAQYTRYLRQEMTDTTLPLSQYPSFASLLYDTTTSDFTSAADNLGLLCPVPDYGTLCKVEEEPRTPYFRYPYLNQDSPHDGHLPHLVTPVTPRQPSIKVEETPSPCIAPTNEDPFHRYFSSSSAVIVPDSLLHLSYDAEQTTIQTASSHLPPSRPTYEPISPVCKTNKHDQSHSEISLPDSSLFVPPAPPSDCSTISYISESSQMSSVSSLSRDSTLALTDFSTVSFHNDSSLSDIFA